MADLNVILNGRARDRGLSRYLARNTKLAAEFTQAIGETARASAKLGSAPALAAPGRQRGPARAERQQPRRTRATRVDDEIATIRKLEIKPTRARVQATASFSKAIDSALRDAARDARAMERSVEREAKAAERAAKAAEKKAKAQEAAARKAESHARQFSSVLDSSLRDVPKALKDYGRARYRPKYDDDGGGGGRGGGGRGSRGANVELGANLAIAGQEFEQLGAKTEQGLRSSYEAFRDYEVAVAEVTTVTSSITEKQIKAITDQAADAFGGEPINQVKAFYEVVSAGAMDEKSATEQLTAANMLAVGGRADIESSVQALSKGVANFASQGETAATVADSIFTAVQLGNARVDEMARALPNVASSASQAGLTLDETNGSLAVLSKRMGSVTVGSNALQQALSNIQKPTKGARDEAKRLGIDFSVAGIKSAGSWSKFIDTIANNPKYDENTLAKLFDSSEARSAIGNLIDGNKDLESTLVAMSKKEGAAAAATARMMDTTAQRAAQLEARWGRLKIQAGEALLPALTDLGAQLVPLIEGTTTWMRENGKSAATIAKWAVGLTVASKAVGVLFSAISMVTSVTGLASGALGSFGGTAAKAGTQSTSAAGKIGRLGSAVGNANLVFAAASVAILGFELAMHNAGKAIEEEHDRLDRLNRSTEEGGLGISFTKVNERGETVEKTEEELLLERRNRLVQDVNAKSKQRYIAGGGGLGFSLEGIGAGAAGLFNRATGVYDTTQQQERQAQLDLARFDRQYGGQLGLSEEQRYTSADIFGGGLTGEGSAFQEMLQIMRTNAEHSQRIAENTAAGARGPGMDSGMVTG